TRLQEAAIRLGETVGYRGVGTVEFLVDPSRDFAHFLEVNTRLQVEHPVTEEVTGIDLVREQLRIAAGEALGYTEVTARGHSLEFRINGEAPAAGFLPMPGTISRLRVPSGPGVRWDSGVVEGDTVSGAFDSMIAKLVVTGATRTQAVERARRALDELVVEGIATVVPFHRAVLDDPSFVPADPAEPFAVHTRWIETSFSPRLADLARPAAPARDATAA
ncbi:MAG TPA: acetyl-/propionyl-CoA carboxylase subunit alpha, partial [Actinotalea sp.]|nr:acetyl-/propionyl-CoA carboxylase subunit alpha [Actinotalea sp.]